MIPVRDATSVVQEALVDIRKSLACGFKNTRLVTKVVIEITVVTVVTVEEINDAYNGW